MGKIKKIKGGAWGEHVDGVGRVELHFRRLTTAQRVGLAALVGRAAEECARHWIMFSQIEADEARATDDAEQLAALQRIHELHEVFLPQTWERVADVLIEYCAELLVDGEVVEDDDDVEEIIRLIPAYDAEAALGKLYKAVDGLSVAEGKPSEPTSAT